MTTEQALSIENLLHGKDLFSCGSKAENSELARTGLMLRVVRAVSSLPRFTHVLDLGHETKVPALNRVTCSVGIGSSHTRESRKVLPVESGIRLME